ncbi:MAG: hypothetical protein AAGE89_12570 [Pseudomonadota bacterium]
MIGLALSVLGRAGKILMITVPIPLLIIAGVIIFYHGVPGFSWVYGGQIEQAYERGFRDAEDVLQVETLKSALEEQRRRAEVVRRQNAVLLIKISETEAEAQAFEEELERYAQENPVNAQCRVDGTVLERLRSR